MERPSTSVTQSLLLLVALLIGIFIGGVIGYLLGQSQVTPSAAVVTVVATAAAPSTTAEPAAAPTAAPSTVTAEAPAAGPASNDPSIPIPVVVTQAPTAQTTTQIDVPDAQASEFAAGVIADTPELFFLSAPAVRFADGRMELRSISSDPTGQLGRGELVVRGTPELRGVRVEFRIDSAELGGKPIPADFYPDIEDLIRGVFRKMIGERPTKAVVVEPGLLRLTVVEPE